MNCNDVQKFIYAYLDGEFDETEHLHMAAHLQDCLSCRELAQQEHQFRNCLRSLHEPLEAPLQLKQRIHQALNEQEEPQTESWFKRWLWCLLPSAAAVLMIMGVFISKHQEIDPSSKIVEESIAWHRQRLPFDVTSTQPESIQNFFSDKLPFAIHLPNFSSRNVELLGARLSHLREHQAAYLVYQVGDKRLSVFIVDPQAIPHLKQSIRVGNKNIFYEGIRGYHVAFYESGGTGYALTSDMDPEQMMQLITHH